ncbi:MAG: hypothetical protein JNL11_11610 [Bdellovibrionaceae bacterium]|nr:hypothetical protein [Pseudobdellovibrionaceae bacterium]
MLDWTINGATNNIEIKMGGKQSRTGLRKKLAAYIPVHTTFISQVLQGHADLSLEQGEAVNSFLERARTNKPYFISFKKYHPV